MLTDFASKEWDDLRGQRIERIEYVRAGPGRNTKSMLLILFSNKKRAIIKTNQRAPGQDLYDSDVPTQALRDHSWFFGDDAYERRKRSERRERERVDKEEKERRLREFERQKERLQREGLIPKDDT